MEQWCLHVATHSRPFEECSDMRVRRPHSPDGAVGDAVGTAFSAASGAADGACSTTRAANGAARPVDPEKPGGFGNCVPSP